LHPVEQPEALARCLSEFLSHAGLWSAAASGAASEPSPAAARSVAGASGMDVRRAVLGDAHVDRASAAATDFDRDFQSYITRMAWGEIWARPGLPLHTRQLLTLVMLATLNRQEELALHVEATRNTGLAPEQVREALMQVAVYAGVPAAHTAIQIAKRVLFPASLPAASLPAASLPAASSEREGSQHG
jgi:4-carboxymuconolactone decarboxylase